MTLRLLTLPLVATLLTACGGSGQPATPAAPATPPTEVAAVKTPPPQYPIELACSGVGGTTTLKVVVGVEGKPTDPADQQRQPATGRTGAHGRAGLAVQCRQPQWPEDSRHDPGAGELQPATAAPG